MKELETMRIAKLVCFLLLFKKVAYQEWPRVPAVGGDWGPAAQHTLAAGAEGLSLSLYPPPPPPRLAPHTRTGVDRDRSLQCSQDSGACGRLETPSCSRWGGERGAGKAASSRESERPSPPPGLWPPWVSAMSALWPAAPRVVDPGLREAMLARLGVTRGQWRNPEMENFSTRTYGTSGLDNRPLFGETSAKDRIINLVVGSLTSLLILVTLIGAFVFPQLPPKPLNIFFCRLHLFE